MTIDQARRTFAEELRFVAHLGDSRVVDAFAAVPREHFVGPGPWRIYHMSDGYWSTPDADPRHLYHNVLVALDESTGLNTGQPSLWAGYFDRLGLRPGERVLQVGTGSGYFTAILAELVGPTGKVLGLEVNVPLAAAAQANLAAWPQASVRPVNGIVPIEGKWDAVIAFAGASAPPALWLDAIDTGGRALIPMTGARQWGFMLRLERTGAGFTARSVGSVGFFHCVGGRDEAEAEALTSAMANDPTCAQFKSLRRDPHEPDESCWLHGHGWCLSKQSLH
jgi:protein-L-isoaspartate(D-aspartate) O-methyltransferase